MASSDAASVPVPVHAAAAAQPGGPQKRRGSYNCGRCGLPKKGHVCSVPGNGKAGEPKTQPQQQNKPRRALQFDDPATEAAGEAVTVVENAVPVSMAPPPPLPPPPPRAAVLAGRKRPRVEVVDMEEDEEDEEEDLGLVELGAGRRAPWQVVAQVLRRISPRGLAAAAGVSRGWRECARRVWRAAEEIHFSAASVRPVGALIARCPVLAKLALRMDR